MQPAESESSPEPDASQCTKSEEDKEDEWIIACSDDEKYYPHKNKMEPMWEPPPADICQLYEILDRVGVVELEWQCPGRRAPSPISTDYYPDEEELEDKPEEKSDFDFMEEMSAPKFPRRGPGEGGPKGSAKKKTTSLDGILSNIRRHRKLAEMEKAEFALNIKHETDL